MFHSLKQAVNGKVSSAAADFASRCFYLRNMRIEHDWYLSAWLGDERGAQTRLSERTGWDKRKTSFLVSGKQPYDRDAVNQAAAALHIAPYELLMHPDDAMALRRLRDTAIRIAAEPSLAYNAEPYVPVITRKGKKV
jgi:hypothetical protein